jgi:hypothetical protein
MPAQASALLRFFYGGVPKDEEQFLQLYAEAVYVIEYIAKAIAAEVARIFVSHD